MVLLVDLLPWPIPVSLACSPRPRSSSYSYSASPTPPLEVSPVLVSAAVSPPPRSRPHGALRLVVDFRSLSDRSRPWRPVIVLEAVMWRLSWSGRPLVRFVLRLPCCQTLKLVGNQSVRRRGPYTDGMPGRLTSSCLTCAFLNRSINDMCLVTSLSTPTRSVAKSSAISIGPVYRLLACPSSTPDSPFDRRFASFGRQSRS